MTAITPQEGIVDTGRMIRAFTKENMPSFWRYLKPLLPYILGLYALDVVVNMIFPKMEGAFGIGGLIAAYFYSCFAITWHRVVLHGPDRAEVMNPFRPEKTDLAFIGMGIGLFVAAFVLSTVSALLIFLGPVGIIVSILAIIGVIFLFAKMCFYFPAKAVKSHMSLKDSFHATKGYIIKIWTAPLVASWRVILGGFVYMIAGTAVLGTIVAMTQYSPDEPPSMMALIGAFAIQVPVLIYFQPVMYAFGIGVLSNYYQHYMQNKSA